MRLSSIFFAVAAAVGAFAQTPDPAINTPTGAQQCLPVQLTFSGTSPPFTVTVVPGGQAGAAPLTTVGTGLTGTSVTWNANLPAGAQYTLVIRDSLGRTNPSGTFTLNPGTDTSCVGAAASGAATSAAPASSPAAATSQPAATSPAAATTPATSAAATSPAASSPAAAGTSKASSASVVSSAAAAATTTHNAGSSLQPVGIAGLVGLAGVAALL